MKYVSFFSGIGSFEIALHKKFPHAKCIGYSEIKPHAIRVYEKHYPGVPNLGDITNIKSLPEIPDLVLGGFPCSNLSSIASTSGTRTGIQGNKSGLFKELVRILRDIVKRNKHVNIILENNANMSETHLSEIMNILQKVMPKKIYVTELTAACFGMQSRKRLFFTSFPVESPKKCKRTGWDSVLEPVGTSFERLSDKAVLECNTLVKTSPSSSGTAIFARKQKGEWALVKEPSQFKSRWTFAPQWSDTLSEKSRSITASARSLVIVDRRKGTLIRYFTVNELERLFGFPKGWVASSSKYIAVDLLGNSIDVRCAKYVMQFYPRK